ncbi:MAG TPA: lysophospholipid acyltransferase family protein [Vicinamibacteria bacterium]|nr:lysophospholipid acyltransferase family protein [Vicinamibacteria bacterium]
MRRLVALPVILAATVALSGPALLGGLLDRSGRLPHAVARLWGRIVLWACGVRVTVEERSGLPTPAVYAANHTSAFDIPLLFGYLPVSFRIIHKKSLSLVPLIGWFLFLGGHVAIDRGNPFKAKRSLERAADRIRLGTSVAVFPEGTRSRDGAVRHFKRGSFGLAMSAGVPVVPVALVGVKVVVPGGIFSVRSGTVRLVTHTPFATAGRNAEEPDVLAEEVRRVVAETCGRA